MTVKGASYDKALEHAARYAREWLDEVGERHVGPTSDADQMRAALGSQLPAGPTAPEEVVDLLATEGAPGLMAIGSGRFYGWVMGGTLPAALAVDWLVSAWDQNTGLRYATPTTVAAEEIAGGWLLELLGLPANADVGFVTGGTMANFTCLNAARHSVLARAGWDVSTRGLNGGPQVHVVVGAERHDTIDLSLRYLGLGDPEVVAADDQGRIDVDALRSRLATIEPGSPTIVCLQAGNVHSGSFDSFADAIEVAHAHGAWVHIDGAFGLWAAASPSLRRLVDGFEAADSWATDAHKTLNVPYDCGVAIVADAGVMRAAHGAHASYLITADSSGPGDPMEKVPEFSRRGRGVTVWAALRSLGRSGVVELMDGLVGNAKSLADALGEIERVEVLNDVGYTQICLSFGSDERTREVTQRIIEDGEVWMSGSRWRDRAVLRISVSNWSTDDEDVRRSVDAVRHAMAATD
jgi:glutamate/tyrosine decarboxylase-like PLP-dependent enzyme